MILSKIRIYNKNKNYTKINHKNVLGINIILKLIIIIATI